MCVCVCVCVCARARVCVNSVKLASGIRNDLIRVSFLMLRHVSLNSPLDGVVYGTMGQCEWSVGPNSSDADGG